jgi:hypothetical protein
MRAAGNDRGERSRLLREIDENGPVPAAHTTSLARAKEPADCEP